ncbi:pyroglutamyl-peptidase I [Xylanimonas oleitrophica]|uniref:Pyroglutamyl-peptidase I n=1 Tax=Xylanimonas oleitrophica TaxID=2607479 RepID=A0A2W5WUK0_9MICO|nr:pyroglutamyl-peptidase I [Xylanimonas oleitrophica]PZR51916.1 pyroglutamyl-peptidase I [Xylanimonas oleitrophica]
MRVLLTGFEPFGGDRVNASWEAVAHLARGWDAVDEGAELDVLRLPVTFRGAPAALAEAVAALRPDVVVAAGLAAGTGAVRLERVAVNVVDARIPDNDGRAPVDEPVVEGAPVAYLTDLPIKAALAALREQGVPAVVSNTAGTYVCNATFYALRHLVATGVAGATRTGFVHVPRTVEEGSGDGGALPVADLAAALGTVVRTTLQDVRGTLPPTTFAAGAEH